MAMDIDHHTAAALGFPKGQYMAIERERVWIARDVPHERIRHSEIITDLYIAGTRLRLRHARRTDTGEQMLRLSRKADLDARTRLITSIYLPEKEFAVLAAALTGARITKLRHRLHSAPSVALAIDEFQGDLAALLIIEAEFDHDETMRSFVPADLMLQEITGDERYTGQSLAANGRPQVSQGSERESGSSLP